MEINVKVVGQDLIVPEYFTYGLVEGSQKFVRFIFELSSDWDGLTVFAQFIQYGHAYNQYLDANNTVELPSEIVAGPCAMLLFGSGSQIRATTSYLKMTISDYLLVEDAESTVITESLYEQMVAMVHDYKSDTDAEIEEFETLIRTFVGGPLVADTVADMTDHTKIYVYTGSETGYTSGNWYYWDGTDWVSGGVYNSIAIGDGSITTEKLADEAVTSAKLSDGAVKSDKIYQKAVTTEKIDDNAVTTPKIALNSVGEAHLKSGLRNTINNKADQNGFYEDLSAGTATQLMSDAYQVDQSPYIFRASGGSLEIGDREQDTLVGMDLVWNQLAKFDANLIPTARDGLTFSYVDGTCFEINGTASDNGNAGGWFNLSEAGGFKDAENHKILCISQLVSGTISGSCNLYLLNGTNHQVGTPWINILTTYSNQRRMVIGWVSGTVFTNARIRFITIDLTAMFGSTIADYIYSLETGTARAGVAWVKRYLTKDYYPYSAPILQNGVASSHDMVGFNQWDEEWEVGNLSVANGSPETDASRIRSKNFCPCFPNTDYKITNTNDPSKQIYILWYDENQNYISWNTNEIVITSPKKARYFKIRSANANHYTSYLGGWCVNFHYDGERDGEYEPYVKHSYPLDDTVDLHGIPKIDASGNLYSDGDTYEADGTVTRRYGVVDLGELTWGTPNANGSVYASATPTPKYSSGTGTIDNILCSKYSTISKSSWYNGTVGVCICGNGYGPNGSIGVCDSDFIGKTSAQVKTAMSGVYLVYELATPTTESAEPFQTPQIVDNWGTEEYVTEGVIPIGHSTKYHEDLRSKIENLNLEMVAPIENGTTASQAYSVGQYFLRNNQFCKAKTSIASGATLTLNTNYEVTTIATELYAALH